MRKVSKNFLSLFISDAASRVLGFVAVVYLARLLSVEDLGLISYCLAFLTYALLFANPGLTIIGAREIAKDQNNRRIIAEILGLRLGLATLILLLFLIGLMLIPGNPGTKKIILIYILTIYPFAMLLEFVFQGREEMQYIGISRFAQYGVYVLLLFLLLKKGEDIYLVPVSFLVGYCVAAGFLIAIFFYKYKSIKIKFSLNFWRNILIMSIPVGLATIFNQLCVNMPPLVLGIFHSKAEVGVFSVGFKLVTMLLIIERVFHFLFFPIVSKQYKDAPEKLGYSFSFMAQLLFAITIPLVCGGFLLSPYLIDFIYGAKFSAAVPVFRILVLYLLVTPLNTVFGYGLVAINQQKRFLKVITITAVINAILIITLGIYFRGQGVAAALFISETVGITLMNRELRKFIKFKSLKYMEKPIIAAIFMIVILYLLRQLHITILIVLGVFVYAIVFFLIKGFSKEELRKLRKNLSN